MHTEFEELVRDSMEWFTEDLQVPADLAGNARRAHQRRKRLAGTAVVAFGTAAVIAAVVILVTVPGAAPGTGGVANARTTAYVIKRVQNALAAENFVIQGQATGTMTVSVHGHNVRTSNGASMSWSYGNRSRFVEFTGRSCSQVTSNGRCTRRGGSKLYLAYGTALVGGKLTGAYVTYFDHKYSLHPLGQDHVKACSPTAQLDPGAPAVTRPSWPAFIKAMLGCGAVTVTGHARIGGVKTIVISGSIDVPLPKSYARTVREARERAQYTLYVDSATYLPVRVYGSDETYGGVGGPTVSASVTNVQWLPPTAANIAKTLITIPAGYTQVSSPAQQ
jgi:hypothetical protein